MEFILSSNVLPALTGVIGICIGFLLNFIDNTRIRYKEDKINEQAIQTEVDEIVDDIKVILTTIDLSREFGFLSNPQKFLDANYHVEFFSKIKKPTEEIVESYNTIKPLRNKLHSTKKFDKHLKEIRVISFQKRYLQNYLLQQDDYDSEFLLFVDIVNGIDQNLRDAVYDLKGKNMEEIYNDN